MFQRFTKTVRAVVEDAATVALQLGSRTVEAEHLLLAVARTDTPAAQALVQHGLDFDGLQAALDRETERSLAAVGVAAEAGPFSRWVTRPRFGTSAKLALQRSLQAAVARKARHIGPAHVALGVLKADVGTVPRALEIAGVDRAALDAALRG